MGYMYDESLFIKFSEFYEKDIAIGTVSYDNWNNITLDINNRMQSFFSIHIVFNGSGIYKYDNKVFKINAGQIFFVPPGLECTYHYDNEESKWDYATFEFTGACAKKYIEIMGMSSDNPIVECKEFDKTFLTLKALFDNYKETKKVKYYDVLTVFYQIISNNMRKSNTKPLSLSKTVEQYINHNYKQPWLTVENISELYNVNPSYLSRIFKKDVGMPIKSYIIKLRIAEACAMLRDTVITIKEVAFAVGFTDEVHFYKTFKKHMGYTPKQHRAKSKLLREKKEK